MFNISGRPVHMSKNNIQLKALSFLNYHDTEEYSTPTMDAWYDMERVLYLKYIAFSTMSELKSLALSRCNAFTASIWRDCFLPCAPRLKRLYLAGWEGRGFRQSPQALLERRAHEEWAGVARIPDEVELALAEFISSLVSIKSIHLNDFYCGHGLVLGLERLNRPYKLCADESGVIDSYINTRLNHFKIIFIYSKT
jgi:hypothetical protein